MDDKDLEKELEKLRNKQASDLQVHKWKVAVRNQLKTAPSKASAGVSWVYWGQLVAAVFAGIVIGGVLFGNQNPESVEKPQEFAYDDATYEVIYTNL